MKAVLVICEGRHDIFFVQRSLGALAGCEWFDQPIRKLPSPLRGMPPRSNRGLIARRFERNPSALTLQATAYPPLPQFESAVLDKAKKTIFMMIRANGKEQVNTVVDLLQNINTSLDLGSLEISGYATAFLFDANDEGLAPTLDAFRDGYGEHFGDLSTANHADWVDARTCHVGAFVIHKSPSNPTGTLEDHLAPLAAEAWPGHFNAASAFIDDGRQTDETASKSEANRLKAIITSAGQFQQPGASLSTLVARKGIPREHFKKCELSQELVRFLQAVPWQEPLEEPADAPKSA